MDSVSQGGDGNDGGTEKQRFSGHKVYTRKAFRGFKNHNNKAIVTASADATPTMLSTITTVATAANDKNNDISTVNEPTTISVEAPAETLGTEDVNCASKQTTSLVDAANDDALSLNPPKVTVSGARDDASGNRSVKEGLDGQMKIGLVSRSGEEKRELWRKLERELGLVRSVLKRIEAKEGQIKGFHNLHVMVNDGDDRRLMRTTSQVASAGTPHEASRFSRPLNQLSLSVLENSQGRSDHTEREKRTPKANQFYRNSEFLLAKDKFPPAESNKKSKLKVKKQGGERPRHGFWPGSKVFKNCSALLERLMKQKNGWIFNSPVDVEGLGLHDYFAIIKHPMDLGTVKSRLSQNRYTSPRELAEDVRLTFRNAMTYNPKGHDVHIMAEQFWKIFEDRWAVIEADYNREVRFLASYDMDLPTPTSKLALIGVRRMLERSESITCPIVPKTKPASIAPVRVPAPKKPKANDPNKREMMYEEKQKLSVSLQSLPPEKLDQVLRIIKKRNPTLCQQDDEIEVDIDSVDNETLWELDRFVTNYKKSLSKNKRKAEIATQARTEAGQEVQEKIPAPVEELPRENNAAGRDVSTSLPNMQKQDDNANRSSSSSSSGSDSGSSSSDSGSESSSSDSGSDAGQSPQA